MFCCVPTARRLQTGRDDRDGNPISPGGWWFGIEWMELARVQFPALVPAAKSVRHNPVVFGADSG